MPGRGCLVLLVNWCWLTRIENLVEVHPDHAGVTVDKRTDWEKQDHGNQVARTDVLASHKPNGERDQGKNGHSQSISHVQRCEEVALLALEAQSACRAALEREQGY